MKFKNLFVLAPLAFLALTGCENTNSDQGNGNQSGGDQGGQTTQKVEFEVAAPAAGEFYVGYHRTEVGVSKDKQGNVTSTANPGYYMLNGEMEGFYLATEYITEDATALPTTLVKATITEKNGKWNIKFNNNYLNVNVSKDKKGNEHLNAGYSTTAFDWTYDTTLNTFTGPANYGGKDVTAVVGTKVESGYTTGTARDTASTDPVYTIQLFTTK